MAGLSLGLMYQVLAGGPSMMRPTLSVQDYLLEVIKLILARVTLKLNMPMIMRF